MIAGAAMAADAASAVLLTVLISDSRMTIRAIDFKICLPSCLWN